MQSWPKASTSSAKLPNNNQTACLYNIVYRRRTNSERLGVLFYYDKGGECAVCGDSLIASLITELQSTAN